eukprot:gene7178-7940_t
MSSSKESSDFKYAASDDNNNNNSNNNSNHNSDKYSYEDEYNGNNNNANIIPICYDQHEDDHHHRSSTSQPPSILKGLDLDLSLAAEAKTLTSLGPVVQEKLINVVFELPDGSQGENAFKLGQTVEVLKSYIESEYGIPMAEQTLYLSESDRLLLNPFSLLDYNEVKGNEEIFVRVEGRLPKNSRK